MMSYLVLLMDDNKKKRRQKYKERVIEDAERKEFKELLNHSLKINKPKTIRELVSSLESKKISREKILPIIREMEQNDEIILQEPLVEPTSPPIRFRDYFFKRNYYSYEHWLVLSSILFALTLVLIDVRTGILFYLRYVIIVFYLLILPGWSFTAALFPELNDKLRFLERVATAIGLSIVILVLVGLFINFTFHFSAISIVLTLTIFIILSQTIATILRLKLARDGFIIKPKQSEQLMEN